MTHANKDYILAKCQKNNSFILYLFNIDKADIRLKNLIIKMQTKLYPLNLNKM